MKKIALFFSSAVLALGFASCDDKSDLGIPQVNPQETIMTAGGITVNYGNAIEGSNIDLNAYKDQQIPVIALALTEQEAAALPEGSEIEFTMQVASEADYSNAAELAVVDGNVAADAWNECFREQLGKTIDARDNYVRFAAYVVSKGQSVRVGTPDTWFAAKKISVTPIAWDYVVEQAYYMVGTATDGQLNTSVPMSHDDADVYDNPSFTYSFEVTEAQVAAGGYAWQIAPASAVAANSFAGVYGVETEGDTALEGSLVLGGKAGKVTEAGNYVLTVNMEESTYKFEKMSYLYTPGASNGWSQTASQYLSYNAEKKYFEGYAHLSGEFKFTSAPNWDGVNYGNAGEEGKLSNDGGAGNLSVDADGLYYCIVDIDNLTYSATLITSYGAIGSFNSWGAQTVMTPSADFLQWSGDVTFTSAEDEWKFRGNDNWDINLGGNYSKLVWNGDNMKAPGEGAYTMTLDFSKLPYSCTFVKK